MNAIESMNNRSSRPRSNSHLSPQEREILEAQSHAIEEMRRTAKSRTPWENLVAAGNATHEFMVPPSQRKKMEDEENWAYYRSGMKEKQVGGEGGRER